MVHEEWVSQQTPRVSYTISAPLVACWMSREIEDPETQSRDDPSHHGMRCTQNMGSDTVHLRVALPSLVGNNRPQNQAGGFYTRTDPFQCDS
jgi:hypothetical protein